jgi:hypothetical protein
MNGLILWWSTFHQRWNWTPWDGLELKGKEESDYYNGRPILSDLQLLKTVTKKAQTLYPEEEGVAEVIESGYMAIWFGDEKQRDFLASQQQWLVCNEI